jgi:hypothetical protein
MDCASPPELDIKQLSAYVDGDADRQVTAHLARCPYCRDRAQRLANWQDRLTAHLYRLTCPGSQELGEYHLGLLSPDRAVAIQQHLLECPHCAREVLQLEDYLRVLGPTIEFSPVERVKVLIAQLISGGTRDDAKQGRLSFAPALAGIRGEADGPAVYQVDDIQIAIEIQDDAELPGHKIVLGLVTGPGSSGLNVTLRQADQIVATTSVDYTGNFLIPRLDPGNYQLILIRPEMEIHVQSLEL